MMNHGGVNPDHRIQFTGVEASAYNQGIPQSPSELSATPTLSKGFSTQGYDKSLKSESEGGASGSIFKNSLATVKIGVSIKEKFPSH